MLRCHMQIINWKAGEFKWTGRCFDGEKSYSSIQGFQIRQASNLTTWKIEHFQTAKLNSLFFRHERNYELIYWFIASI